MLRTPPAPAIKARSIEQQNTDFTAEGSPPPGTVGTLVQLTDTTPVPAKSGAIGRARRGYPRARLAVPTESAPKLPHERDESINTAGTISSEPMKQADRDVKRGLVDTDRGAEAGRTYRKLKQSR
jgi:hypothetical protein